MDARMKALEQRLASLENPPATPADGASASSRVRLNVGGAMFETTQSTLCSVEGSMLASMFSGRWATDARNTF